MKKLILSIVFACTVLLCGCAPKALVTMEAPILETDSKFLERCTADTPVPENPFIDKDGKKLYNGVSSMETFQKWQTVYDDCALKHDALINVILELQKNRTVLLKKEH